MQKKPEKVFIETCSKGHALPKNSLWKGNVPKTLKVYKDLNNEQQAQMPGNFGPKMINLIREEYLSHDKDTILWHRKKKEINCAC